MVLILVPIAWFFGHARAEAASSFLRVCFTIALCAPVLGIVVAVWRLIRFVVARRSVRLRVGEDIFIPRTGIFFPTARLGALQLFTHRNRAYVALLPDHIEERLTPRSIATQQHSLDGYVVEFPDWPTLQTFELAERLQHHIPGLEVRKLGTIHEA